MPDRGRPRYDAAVSANDAGLALSIKNTFCLIHVRSLDSRSWSEQKGSFYLFCEGRGSSSIHSCSSLTDDVRVNRRSGMNQITATVT